ncbi:immediate early response gene 2 protein-like [Lates japonicus]|uniref:Immediate early response gene 2 protein-like protein n=1 Tax=Lates japonicus TaxID=270547 RepID=A0AAD3MTM7_LATJO|nr:immediate early response gene 2 protein-like protein [Lates japonicus]
MEVSAEAKRIMVVALGKLYSSRSQRGGLRLHRSLLLTLVMKSARDMYHAAQATAESVAPGCEEQQQQHQQEEHPAAQTTPEPTGAHVEFQGPPSLATGEPRTSPRQEVGGSPMGGTCAAENKENQCPTGPAQHSRKRRGKAAVEPDFLPCKKAKLEQGNCSQQLIVNPVLVDYVNCSSGLGSPPTPMPLLRAIAAC